MRSGNVGCAGGLPSPRSGFGCERRRARQRRLGRTALSSLVAGAIALGAFGVSASGPAHSASAPPPVEEERNESAPASGAELTGSDHGLRPQLPTPPVPEAKTTALSVASSAEPVSSGYASMADLCALVERHARRHRLPASFFTRLIWKESRFDRDAVSPKGAQGIAQFMPGTAAERGLVDPFDPDQAIAHSARFLRELHDRFGNIGLAAAAYNAGAQRVQNWIDGRGSLPAETQEYVHWITGRIAADWQPPDETGGAADGEKQAFDQGCPEFVTLASRGHVSGRKKAARRLPNVPQVARHLGHKLMTANSPAGQQAAGKPGLGGEPTVSQLAMGKGKPMYAVQAGAQTHLDARKTCARLRASGSHCVVVVR